MGLYLSAVEGTDPDTMDGSVRSSLSNTYSSASKLSVAVCGKDYVQTSTSMSSTSTSWGIRCGVNSFILWALFVVVGINLVC